MARAPSSSIATGCSVGTPTAADEPADPRVTRLAGLVLPSPRESRSQKGTTSNPAWSFQWRDLVTGLRSAFRCVALDYRGFGLSTAPDGYGFTPREQSRVVEEFVDHLGLRDVTLVMQDWGGPIGLGWAGRRPELVRRVILGNTWAWPTTVSEARGKFSVIVGGPIGEFAQMNFNAFASFALSHGIIRKLPEEVFDVYLRPFLPLNQRGVAAFYPGQITVASDYMREVEAGTRKT